MNKPRWNLKSKSMADVFKGEYSLPFYCNDVEVAKAIIDKADEKMLELEQEIERLKSGGGND